MRRNAPVIVSRASARRPWAGTRGSLMLVVLLFAAVIGLSLTSYLRLATTSLRTANRGFYTTAAVDLAQSGVEEAMAALYQLTRGDTMEQAWNGWNRTGTDATRTFTGFKPGPNAQGVVRVLVKDYPFFYRPIIIVKATVTTPDGAAIDQYLEVKTQPRALFSRGLIARQKLQCGAGPTFDSWDSDPDRNPGTPPVAYSSAVARPNTSIGSSSSTNAAVMLKDAKVYGVVHTGGGDVQYTGNAVISGSFAGTGVDQSRIRRDLIVNFPEIELPNVSSSALNRLTTSPGPGTHFPRPGDVRAPDQKYYYSFGMGTGLGIDSTKAIYVEDHCIFLFQNHTNVESIGNKGDLIIEPGASLVIYTNGHVSSEGGRGFINGNNAPAACIIYGTDTDPGRQKVTIGGISGGGMACYMPNADLTLTGNGSICGAFIGYRVELKGTSSAFHFDEALTRIGNRLGACVAEWRQLHSPADRATYANAFNF